MSFAGLVAVTRQVAAPEAFRFDPVIEQLVPVAVNVGAIAPEPPVTESDMGVPAIPVSAVFEITSGFCDCRGERHEATNADTSSRPPVAVRPDSEVVAAAEDSNAERICFGVIVGFTEAQSAMAPVTCGVAIEVPL
ncbi:unannotated protein [freshwater metagenome]|uniref:Unannotated protein n=1 Tax=freshwater metagenome TaxID=449393 RepID=A0A6J6QQJ9_9ZZZZ